MRIASFLLPTTHPRGSRYSRAHQDVRQMLLATFGGFSTSTVEGAWTNDAGQVIYDTSVRYEVAADWTPKLRLKLAEIAYLGGFRSFQDVVMLTYDDGEVEMVSTKGFGVQVDAGMNAV